MKIFGMFRQPYLDAPDDFGGGGDPTPSADPAVPGGSDPTPTPQGGSDPTPPPEQMFKLKYNHEEKEIPYSQAIELAQKGMNYDKAIERERQAARDAVIAEQGYVWNGKPITTESEYKQALTEKAEQERRAELQEKGIDPSIVDEAVANNPAVKWANEFKSQQEATEFVQKDQMHFLEWFEKENGRPFDVKTDVIPPEVFQKAELYQKSRGKEGESLVDAYIKHDYVSVKGQYKDFESKKEELRQNAVKEYLEGLKKGNKPVEGSGSPPVVVPSEPKTFDDAKKGALEFLKQSKTL